MNPIEILQSYAKLSTASLRDDSIVYLSDDGQTLFYLGSNEETNLLHQSTADATIHYDTSTLQESSDAPYSLAAIYLLCVNPRDILPYRKACDRYGKISGVKVVDRKEVLVSILGEEGYARSQGADGAATTSTNRSTAAEEESALMTQPPDFPSTIPASSSMTELDDEKGEVATDGDPENQQDRGEVKTDILGHDKVDRHKSREHRHDRNKHSSSSARDKHGHHSKKHKSGEAERHHSKHKHHSLHKHKSSSTETDSHAKTKERHSSNSSHKYDAITKEKIPMTNEEVLENLSQVARKRTEKLLKAAEKAREASLMTSTSTPSGATTEDPVITGAAMPVHKETAKDDTAALVSPTTAIIDEDEQPSSFSLSNKVSEVGSDEWRKQLTDALSAKGYVPIHDESILDLDRPLVQRITSMEIPVGSSRSILRVEGKDLSRALELYNERRGQDERRSASAISDLDAKTNLGGTSSSSRAAASGSRDSRSGAKRPHPPPESPHPPPSSSISASIGSGGTNSKPLPSTIQNKSNKMLKSTRPAGIPIIIVPNAMTAPITMVNAEQFFTKAQYIPRDVALRTNPSSRKASSIRIKRRVNAKFGGGGGGSGGGTAGAAGEMEYEIIDNPVIKLKSSSDWDRIVAVVAHGASWQFKGWKHWTTTIGVGEDGNPVKVFSQTFGFYIGMEGAPPPKEILGWNVKKQELSRDKRGMDGITYSSFWNRCVLKWRFSRGTALLF